MKPTTTLTSTLTTGTNRLASVSGGTTTRQLSYDGRGNIGGDVRGTVTNTALYDAYGRLGSYASTGVSTWVMKYNGDDERVEVKIGTGTPRRFVYDEDGRLIGEYGNTVATINAEHVWLMPAANEGGYEPLALVGPTTTSWVHGGQPRQAGV
jgi:YD repeat-containing protein